MKVDVKGAGGLIPDHVEGVAHIISSQHTQEAQAALAAEALKKGISPSEVLAQRAAAKAVEGQSR